MPPADVRAELEAIARGKAQRPVVADATLVDEKAVEALQPDFRPWLAFAQGSQRRGGERLTAPAGLLVPLP